MKNYSRRDLYALGEPLGDCVTQPKVGGGYVCGGGGKGGGGQSAPTNQTVTQTNIPEYMRPYAEKMIGQAWASTQQPYQTYGGQRLSDFTPMQQQAFQSVQNLAPAWQLGAASDMAGAAGLGALNAGNNAAGYGNFGAGMAGMGFGAGQQYENQATDPSQMQRWMSPYTQNVIDATAANMARQSQVMGTQNAAAAAKAGAFGGSRFGVQEGQRQAQLGYDQGQMAAQQYQNAFQNAQQAQQYRANLGLQGMQQGLGALGLGITGAGTQLQGLNQLGQAAQTIGQLGQTEFGQNKDIINALQAAGAQQQDLQQQYLSQQYQDFLNQKMYPQQQLSWFSDILRGSPGSQSVNTMQSQYQAPPSTAAQLANLGIAGLGAYKLFQGV